MAKKQEEAKTSKILELLTTEYPAESYIMAFLGILVTVMGVYLIKGDITIPTVDTIPLKWIFGTETGVLIFSIVITVFGAVAIVVALWPFFKPSIVEMKRVSWPNGITLRNHTARVFGFILFLAAVFILYDLGLQPLIEWIKSFGG